MSCSACQTLLWNTVPPGSTATLNVFRRPAKLGPQRLASLDADAMLADPARALRTVAAHYGLTMREAQLAEVLAGPALSQHSKSGAAYSSAARAADYARVRAAHGEEIGMVMVWAQAVAKAAGVSMDAPNPLLQA